MSAVVVVVVIDIARAQSIYEKEKCLKLKMQAEALTYKKLLEDKLQKVKEFTFKERAETQGSSSERKIKKPEFSYQETSPIFLSSYLASKSLAETHRVFIDAYTNVNKTFEDYFILDDILLSFRPFLYLENANLAQVNLSVECTDGERRPYASFFKESDLFNFISDDDEFDQVLQELLKRMLNLYNFIFKGTSKLDKLTLKDFRALRKKLIELYPNSPLINTLEPILEITESSLEGIEENYERIESEQKRQAEELKKLGVKIKAFSQRDDGLEYSEEGE